MIIENRSMKIGETTKKAAGFRKEKECIAVELKSVTQRLEDYQQSLCREL